MAATFITTHFLCSLFSFSYCKNKYVNIAFSLLLYMHNERMSAYTRHVVMAHLHPPAMRHINATSLLWFNLNFIFSLYARCFAYTCSDILAVVGGTCAPSYMLQQAGPHAIVANLLLQHLANAMLIICKQLFS